MKIQILVCPSLLLPALSFSAHFFEEEKQSIEPDKPTERQEQGSNMDYPTAPSEQLSRPLLSEEEEEKKFDVEDEEEAMPFESSGTLIVPASADKDENDDAQANNDDDGQGAPAEGAADEEEDKPFTIKNEIVEMASLALPLAISFFCRMGMARYVHPCLFILVLFPRKFPFVAHALLGDLGTLLQPIIPLTRTRFSPSEYPNCLPHNIVCLSLRHMDLISYYLQYGLGIRGPHSRQSKHGRNLPRGGRPIRYGGECSHGPPTGLQSGPQCPGRSGHRQQQSQDGRHMAPAVHVLVKFDHAAVFGGMFLRRTHTEIIGLSRGGGIGGGDLCQVQCGLADTERAVSVHAILLPGSGPAKPSHVQQPHIFVCQRRAQLGVCVRRTLSLPVRLDRIWFRGRRHFVVHLSHGPERVLLFVHVCVQASSCPDVAGVGVEASQPSAYGRVFEAIGTQHGHAAVPAMCQSGNDGADWSSR